ncbi:MAG: hypothetical protein KME42_02660 [Tildeniella nuda ZEHNDER 1965/U140]|jgi:hypothetical protein|nr:hypothetical protein [Tildeniella nuda ZEHNDER 1965/U140]
MEPGSPSASTSERSTNWTADFIGIVIAILTLTVPLAVIAYYSSSSDAPSATGYVKQRAESR